MAWISVYQEVDGPKLRRLSKLLGCCKAEALGILNYLWFWGMNNADMNGRIMEAEREDIEDALTGISKIDSATIVEALFAAGWLDDFDGNIFIHDWDQWQEQWYKLKKTREANAERVRRYRDKEKTGQPEPEGAPPGKEAPADEPLPDEAPPAAPKAKSAKSEPAKKKYAEYVRMTEEEYGRLIEKFGMLFTTACIEELDNYKGAKGKTYKNDYRAILSWVVDRVNERRPGLMRASKETVAAPQDGTKNPFEEWGEKSG